MITAILIFAGAVICAGLLTILVLLFLILAAELAEADFYFQIHAKRFHHQEDTDGRTTKA
jgi:hypothetical protein